MGRLSTDEGRRKDTDDAFLSASHHGTTGVGSVRTKRLWEGHQPTGRSAVLGGGVCWCGGGGMVIGSFVEGEGRRKDTDDAFLSASHHGTTGVGSVRTKRLWHGRQGRGGVGGACGDDVENWTYRNFFFLLLGTWFGFGAWGVARGSWFLGRVVGFASWSAACAAWQAVGVRG